MVEVLKQNLKKLYSTGALHVTIGTFATKFVAFFGSIVVVRLLTKTEYGLMSYVENIYSYALIFAALGLSNAILRYLVIVENQYEKKQYFGYIMKHSVIRNIIIMIIICFVSQFIKYPDNYADAKYLLPIVALLLPFQDLVNDDLYTLRSFFENKLYAYVSFLVSITLILGRILGAVCDGVNGVLWSRVIINFLFGTLGYIFIKRKYFCEGKVDRLPRKSRKLVNIYSFQYMITNGFWALFMLNDTFLLGLLLNDPSGLAEYKVACVLPGNISIFATAIGVFVAPYFTKNEQNSNWVKSNFKKVYLLSVGTVGAVSLGIGAFATPLIEFMYGEQYLNIVGLMRVLLLAAFINSGLRYTTANILAAMGKVKYNMIISGIGIIVQIILDIILIPRLGIIAGALSNCIVFTIMSILLMCVYKNILQE
ncbi:hypothetical protein C806_01812 [Lachnospiraceae bacterium 3-1]|nr:hypothetical protein C806_01812 [Lachnospiraceae bacterium 3-1]